MIANWGMPLAGATAYTLLLALIAFPLGTAIGMSLVLPQRRSVRVIRKIFVTVLRGIPELTILYTLYFSLTPVLKSVSDIGDPQVVIAVAALALVSAANQAEILRGALAAVPVGEIEASQAFGLSSGQVFRRVTLPHLMAFALPGLGNAWQGMLKTTAIVSLIGLTEIMRQTMLAAASTLRPFLLFATAGAIYLALALVSFAVFHCVRKRLGWAGRR